MSQTTDVRKDKSHACATDFPVYCKEEIPSDTNYWGCLGRKMNMLSPKCTEFMKVVYKEQNDCGKDILTFCNGSKMNYGNWVPCLKDKKSSVSNKCSRMLDNLDKRLTVRKAILETCKTEKEKNCAKLTTEACVGKINKLPESELSTACKAKVNELKALL